MELSATRIHSKAERSFKRLELGTVPADWTEVTLFETAGKRKERFDDGDWIEAEFITDKGVRLVQTGNIGEGEFLHKAGKKYVSEESFQFLGCKEIRSGDLLISRLAAPAGRACILPNLGEKKMITSVDVTIVRPIDGVADPRYLNQLFLTRNWFEAVAIRCGGTTHSRIPRSELGKIVLPLPDIEEQRAIATALSDVDALLGSLDALIAKKKAIKQGAMQQLLTGKQRLPGFKGEWEVKTFGDVVRHHAGNSTLIKGKLYDSPATGRFNGYSASGQDVWLDHFEHEGEAIVVSAVGSRCGRSFLATGKWSAIANTHVVWAKRDKVDMRFLGLYINDENFWLKSGSGQPFVLVRQSFARNLPLPPKEEQTAIATVLSDMDAEIGALEARRAKTALLKQGMMQELLTGRTRLV